MPSNLRTKVVMANAFERRQRRKRLKKKREQQNIV